MGNKILKVTAISFVILIALAIFYRTTSTGYTLTINAIKSGYGEEERIDLGWASNDNSSESKRIEPEVIFLALTNLSGRALTYTHHSTGPFVKWEFEFNGDIYEVEKAGVGSGVHRAKTLDNKQSGVLMTRLYYNNLPEVLQKAIMAGNDKKQHYIRVKTRATLTVDVDAADPNRTFVSVSSDWTMLHIGLSRAPQ